MLSYERYVTVMYNISCTPRQHLLGRVRVHVAAAQRADPNPTECVLAPLVQTQMHVRTQLVRLVLKKQVGLFGFASIHIL